MAFWASTVLLSSIHLAIQFHLAVPDPYLIFFFCWSLFLFYSAIKTNKLGDKILLYISIGLATLTKGPMAIALPGLIFLLFLIFSKQFNWKTIKKLQPFMGLVIVAAIALPWFIINGIETNWEWTKGFFIHHNIDRFSSKMEGHGGIFLLTFVFVILGMFPFSAFLIQAIGLSVKKRENKFLLFNLIAASTIILFFSISKTKLPNYTVPAYPFLAIILAYYIDNFKKIKSLKPSFIFILILALTVFIGGFWGLNIDTSLASASSKIWWFMVLPIGVFISILFIIKRKTEQSFLTLTLTGIITSLVFFMFVYPAVDNLNPVKKSLHLLKGKEVAYYKKFNASYSFYLKKKIPELTETEFDIFFSEHHDGIIISIQKQIDQIKLPQNCEVIFSGKDIMEIPTTVLISKKK
jgi:4-amino-4-deoxy-L-arabinose transferase-like glycosyltransferase